MVDEYINREDSKVYVPLSVFEDRTVSILEALVEYLKDKRHLTYHQIAKMLNRDDRTIWTVYNRLSKKRGAKK